MWKVTRIHHDFNLDGYIFEYKDGAKLFSLYKTIEDIKDEIINKDMSACGVMLRIKFCQKKFGRGWFSLYRQEADKQGRAGLTASPC